MHVVQTSRGTENHEALNYNCYEYKSSKEITHSLTLVRARDGDVHVLQRRVGVAEGDHRDVDIRGLLDGLQDTSAVKNTTRHKIHINGNAVLSLCVLQDTSAVNHTTQHENHINGNAVLSFVLHSYPRDAASPGVTDKKALATGIASAYTALFEKVHKSSSGLR